MLPYLISKFFGSIWILKERCNTAGNPFLKNLYIRIYERYQDRCASSIAWNSQFAGIPCTPHGIKNIFVSGSARVGRNCVIFQQVTIGSNTLADSKGIGAPVIGDDCYIGAGAKIIGNVKVGNNVRIGANAVVTKDVPDNSVVVPGEQRIITKDFPLDNRFISYAGRWVFRDGKGWKEIEDEDLIEKLNKARYGE